MSTPYNSNVLARFKYSSSAWSGVNPLRAKELCIKQDPERGGWGLGLELPEGLVVLEDILFHQFRLCRHETEFCDKVQRSMEIRIKVSAFS